MVASPGESGARAITTISREYSQHLARMARRDSFNLEDFRKPGENRRPRRPPAHRLAVH